MDAQVTAALISGGAALAVAVLGIGGAITAQLFTTRHALENSLALQERQYARQERERQETIEAVERLKGEQRALRARAQAQDDALEREREEKRRQDKQKFDQEVQDMIDDVNALKAGIDPSQCSYCNGSGRFLSNAGPRPCSYCNGSGKTERFRK